MPSRLVPGVDGCLPTRLLFPFTGRRETDEPSRRTIERIRHAFLGKKLQKPFLGWKLVLHVTVVLAVATLGEDQDSTAPKSLKIETVII